MIFLMLILAVLVETQIFAVGWYVIVGVWGYFRYGLKNVALAIGLGGIILDVLVPRMLGITPLLLLLILLFVEWLLFRQEFGRERYAVVGVLIVLIEGVVIRRGLWMIVAGALIYLGMVFVWQMFGWRERELVVRRRI